MFVLILSFLIKLKVPKEDERKMRLFVAFIISDRNNRWNIVLYFDGVHVLELILSQYLTHFQKYENAIINIQPTHNLTSGVFKNT